MKKIYIIIFLSIFNIDYAQNEKSLEETKSYIVNVINENGWKENSNKNRLHAEFNGDFLKIFVENKYLKVLESETTYNFANVYKYRGPIRKPGDIAHLIIWVDYLSNEKTGKWKKNDFEFDIHNYEIGEQLMKAFRHLNKLLIEKRPPVEKF